MSRKTLGLLALAACALALRLAVVYALPQHMDRPQTYEHGEIARNLLAGRGFVVTFLGQEGPTSQQAPFVPLLLAAVYSVTGIDSVESLVTFQVLQCLAGVALVLCTSWLAWSLYPADRRIGWCAGWSVAVFPTHVYMVTHVQAASWAATCLVALWAVIAAWRKTHPWRAACCGGILAGLLLLVEPILALTLPFAAWWLLQAQRTRGATLLIAVRPVCVMTSLALLLIAPWLIRNVAVHGQFVFIKSTFGYAFWQGNNPLSWGTDKIPKPAALELAQAHDGSLADRHRALWAARHETLYIDDVLLKPTGYAPFIGLTEPQRSALLGREARQFIAEQPFAYLRLCLYRLGFFLGYDPTNPKASSWPYRVTSGVWLALTVCGIALTHARWRRMGPLLLAVLSVMLFHVLTIYSARFRIPLEPLGLVWGAMAFMTGLDGCCSLVRSIGSPRDAQPRGTTTSPC